MIDISVIVPVYGVEQYIERSLRTLFSQTKIDGVEVILVNDCTPDNSMQIVANLKGEFSHLDIKVINQPQNGGVAKARQTGLDAATGEYTIHFDPDDTCKPEMLEEMYAFAIENSADVVVADYIIETPQGDVYSKQPTIVTPHDGIKMMLEGTLFGVLWNKLIKRSILVDNNIQFISGVNTQEDLVICTKVFCNAAKIVNLSKAYYQYRPNVNSRYCGLTNKILSDIISNTNEIERYFISNSVLNNYKDALIKKKVHFKFKVMLTVGRGDRDKYYNITPEIDKYIMACSYAPTYWRYALLQASKGRVWVFNAVDTLIAFKDRVIGRTAESTRN